MGHQVRPTNSSGRCLFHVGFGGVRYRSFGRRYTRTLELVRTVRHPRPDPDRGARFHGRRQHSAADATPRCRCIHPARRALAQRRRTSPLHSRGRVSCRPDRALHVRGRDHRRGHARHLVWHGRRLATARCALERSVLRGCGILQCRLRSHGGLSIASTSSNRRLGQPRVDRLDSVWCTLVHGFRRCGTETVVAVAGARLQDRADIERRAPVGWHHRLSGS